MQELLKTMRRLRAPDGCPWDIKQTHLSLRPYLLEEAAEAVDAISSGDTNAMAEELGDVLLQVAFHAVIAEQENSFNYDVIEESIVDKLIRRHPHVFSDTEVKDADEVVANWQTIKANEKKEASPVPNSLSALMRTSELYKHKSWQTSTHEELVKKSQALEPTSESIADLLIGIVGFARENGINAELALRDALLERE